jgi:hypothetical protein
MILLDLQYGAGLRASYAFTSHPHRKLSGSLMSVSVATDGSIICKRNIRNSPCDRSMVYLMTIHGARNLPMKHPHATKNSLGANAFALKRLQSHD